MKDPARILLADPPWKFGDKLPGTGRGASKHYPVLSVDEICSFALPPVADDALLFMWRVSARAGWVWAGTLGWNTRCV